MTEIAKLFDSYGRVARLYPALLASAPLVWTLGTIQPDLLSDGKSKLIVTLIVAFGGLVLLGNLARSCGKNIEEKLIHAWGGMRTTILLRHSDPTLDRFTKGRYHLALQNLCGDSLVMPTQEQELAAPLEANEKYRSATKCLIENRRDKKYDLLHKELAAYGFRRNLLGLKPVCLLIIAVSTAINLIAWQPQSPPAMQEIDVIVADAMARWQIYIVFLANAGYLVIWLTLINPRFVLNSANEYALALFRTLDGAK